MTRFVIRLSIVSSFVPALLMGCASVGMAPGPELSVVPDGVVGRAITEENPKGEPGQGGRAASRNLGATRKGAPCRHDLKNGDTAVLMDYAGCGIIRHIWMTVDQRDPEALRNMILRMYWDGSRVPSVEVPLGDFFGTAHGRAVELNSSLVSVPRGAGFNCFFPMPFATHAKITLENDMPGNRKMGAVFYQIDFEMRDRLPARSGRFHAQFRRQNPTVPRQDYVLLDDVQGPGAFIGCVIGVRPLQGDWWGEGELKLYMDGDEEFPTICGTGTEDYFCAAWGMEKYQKPYHGCTLLMSDKDFPPAGLVSMYRWHEKDPIYFRESLRVEIQQIGWGKNGLFERSDDWCSTVFWYQLKPVLRMPPLPDRAARTADIVPAKKADANLGR